MIVKRRFWRSKDDEKREAEQFKKRQMVNASLPPLPQSYAECLKLTGVIIEQA